MIQITFRHVWSSIVWILIIAMITVFYYRCSNRVGAAFQDVNYSAELTGCTIHNNRCVFVIEQQKFDVTFLKKPATDEENRFSITSSAAFSLDNSWVEGVNMYMGKTPVIVEQQNSQDTKALLYLGSCNLNSMEWQLILNFKHKAHPAVVRFTTAN